MCVKCNVHLCEAHFQVYHTKNYESSDDEDEVVENLSRYEKIFKKILLVLSRACY